VPAGGAGLIACATAWHWMEPATRNRRAFDALAPGGTLALFGHAYGYADPGRSAAIDGFFTSIDPDPPRRDEHWVRTDVTASGVWADVEERIWHTYPVFPKERYLALVQTFSPFRRHSPEVRARTLAGLGALIDGFGGELTLDLVTSLVLARRG
jgi:hypothetical protein